MSLITYFFTFIAVACVAAESNARVNDARIRTCSANLINGGYVPGPFDVVLLGDLLYDEAMAKELVTWLETLNSSTEIYLADPGRHGLTEELKKSRLEHLRTYELPGKARLENYGFYQASVWRYSRR